MELEVVIGLEVHVQLGTRTKLFCACPSDFAGTPNSRICPVCTGQPGVLPVLNDAALELALRAAVALGSTIPTRTWFDRKNYFYPDLPKGYQISQFDAPVAVGGEVVFEIEDGSWRTARLVRAHLEEDAGKAIHEESRPTSLVDLNRAGIPLIEIVGEPDLRAPEEAAAFLASLRRTLRFAGVSDCDMEKGSMRCDANVSLRPAGSERLGTKVEVKNMNSIRNVERALHHEIARQREVLEQGATVVQETRSFRDGEGVTISMRGKEEADDYRYFPEPDLPEFVVEPERVDRIRAGMPGGWRERRERYRRDLGLPDADARRLTEEPALADWFEGCLTAGLEPRTAANWLQVEVLAFVAETGVSLRALKITPHDLGELVALVEHGTLSHQAGKKVLRHMLETGSSAELAARQLDLLQIRDDSVLEGIVEEVIAAETRAVADYRGGKAAALNALLGRVMRASKGKGDPQRIRELLVRKLGE